MKIKLIEQVKKVVLKIHDEENPVSLLTALRSTVSTTEIVGAPGQSAIDYDPGDFAQQFIDH